VEESFNDLMTRLSGKPPAVDTDFSSLEAIGKTDSNGDGGATTPAPDSARRKQSYFRVRTGRAPR
jgi:hypothetical protein